MTDSERRREARLSTNIEVDYEAEGTFLIAYIKDISSMGIFVRTDEPRAVGSTLQLRFTPPPDTRAEAGDEPLNLTGEVMWNTLEGGDPADAGMGVRFINLDREQRSRLMTLVRAIAYLDDKSGN